MARKKPTLRVVGNEPPDSPIGRRNLTKTDRMKLLQLVEQMMLDGHRFDQIYQVTGADFSIQKPIPAIGKPYLRQLITTIEQLWADDAKASRSQNRQKSINRLTRHMREARKVGRWNAVCQIEDMIAKLQGLYEPERVTVSFQAADNISAILSTYTDDEIRKMSEKQLEIHHKADQYERSIDTIGELLPAQTATP